MFIRKNKRLTTLFAFTSFFIASTSASAGTDNSSVKQLADTLNGVFDSSSQAIDDSAYLDVTVRHCKVTMSDLPTDLQADYFLALRQSVSTQGQPYRARILRLFSGTDVGEVLVSSYAVSGDSEFNDICFKPQDSRIVSFKKLSEEKCTTEIRLRNGVFVGGTTNEGCPNSRSGAVRMTSEITIDKNGMTTWDRGWDAAGKVVWGPEKGPYRFERVAAQDPRLAQLASFFSGRFSNAEQSQTNPKDFIPVSYQFCQIDTRENPQRPNTRLMLAQQTVTTPARTIQRNRIYEFFRNADGKISVRTNPFDESKIPADICERTLQERRALDESILSQRDSCVLNFEWNQSKESFIGGTPLEGCASNFQGAVKLTIEEEIKDGLIAPWERWFNAQGEQVAGSRVGPYVYKRLNVISSTP